MFENAEYARAYADKHGMRPVETTEGGQFLDKPSRFMEYGYERAISLWVVASQKYARHIKGDVRTFVCCATPHSVFRSVELPIILANRKIKTINGKPRKYYAGFKDRLYQRLRNQGKTHEQAAELAMDAAYRLVAREEIRMDLQSGDKTLQESALVRQQAMKDHAKEELKARATSAFEAARIARQERIDDVIASNPRLVKDLQRVFSKLPKTPAGHGKPVSRRPK